MSLRVASLPNYPTHVVRHPSRLSQGAGLQLAGLLQEHEGVSVPGMDCVPGRNEVREASIQGLIEMALHGKCSVTH